MTDSPEVVSEESQEKSYRRARSVSPMSAAVPLETTINAVQTVLNKRQLQVNIISIMGNGGTYLGAA